MSLPGDDMYEMTGNRSIGDDDLLDLIVAGRPVPAEAAPLVAFAYAVRAAGNEPCRASVQLAELITTGIVTDKGDPSVRAASKASGPAHPQASGLPKRRRHPMLVSQLLAAAVAKFAAAGGVAHAAAGVSIALAGVTGAGAVGALPAPVQDRFAEVVEAVSPFDASASADVEVGGTDSDTTTDDGQSPEPEPTDETTTETTTEPEPEPSTESEEGTAPGQEPVQDEPVSDVEPDQSSFGTSVSEDAKDGGVDGAETSSRAREAHQPQDAPADAPKPAQAQDKPTAPAEPAPVPVPVQSAPEPAPDAPAPVPPTTKPAPPAPPAPPAAPGRP